MMLRWTTDAAHVAMCDSYLSVEDERRKKRRETFGVDTLHSMLKFQLVLTPCRVVGDADAIVRHISALLGGQMLRFLSLGHLSFSSDPIVSFLIPSPVQSSDLHALVLGPL